MIDKRIVYNVDDGIAIIIPTGDLPIEEVARKDVPQGVAYKIIDVSDIPGDRTFRNAWEIGEFEPDGYGDPEGWWSENDSN